MVRVRVMGYGLWVMGYGLELWVRVRLMGKGYGLRLGLWVMSCGLWVMGCGLWVVGYGLWVMGCGLWVVGYGFWVVGSSQDEMMGYRLDVGLGEGG